MELDIVAFNPITKHLIHLEPSLDAHSWAKREERYKKKFQVAKKYVFKEVFTWLSKETPIEQVAILISHPKGRDTLAGGNLISVNEFMETVKEEILKQGKVSQNAIAEQYPMLRTLQLSINGYY